MKRELAYISKLSQNWQELLFHDLLPYARIWTRRWTSDEHAAFDLAWDAVEKMGQDIGKLQTAENMRAWALEVMRNLDRDQGRRALSRKKGQEGYEAFKRNVSDTKEYRRGRASQKVQSTSFDLPLLLQMPDPDHWLMTLLERTTGENRTIVLIAAEVGWDSERMALRYKELPEYQEDFRNLSIKEAARKVDHKLDKLRAWLWEYVGLFPEVEAHRAYDADVLYKSIPISNWKEMLMLEVRSIILNEENWGVKGWRNGRQDTLGDGDFASEYYSFSPRHIIGRAAEFTALNFHRKSKTCDSENKSELLTEAIRGAETACYMFHRERLSTHHDRCADHYKRIDKCIANLDIPKEPTPPKEVGSP